MKKHQQLLTRQLLKRLIMESKRLTVWCAALESTGDPNDHSNAEDFGYARDRIDEAIEAIDGSVPTERTAPKSKEPRR